MAEYLGEHRTARASPERRGVSIGTGRLMRLSDALNAAPSVRHLESVRPASEKPVIQRYVVVGREQSDVSKNLADVMSGASKRRLLRPEDADAVLDEAIDVVAYRERKSDPGELTPEYVSRSKNLAAHMRANREQLRTMLLAWIGAPGETMSVLGVGQEAQWRQYGSVYELGLALAHETHPDTRRNLRSEERLADTVNGSPWIEQRLAEVMSLVESHKQGLSGGRQAMEMVESGLFGSYKHGDYVGRIGRGVAKVTGRESTKDRITSHITTLHDLMERWSSSQAGSMAASLHEAFGVEAQLPNPDDAAMASTMIDPANSDLGGGERSPHIVLHRDTRRNTEEDRTEVETEIHGKRERAVIDKIASAKTKAQIGLMGQRGVVKLTHKLQQKLVAKYPGISDHRDSDLQPRERSEDLVPHQPDGSRETLRRRGKEEVEAPAPVSLVDTHTPEPERNMLARKLNEHFTAKREQDDAHRLKQVEPGTVAKTSKAKGRHNVGTRDEFAPETLLSRLFSAPVWAGRSMTTARMMKLVEMLGGRPEHRTAVAYALFAYWRRTYNKGLTAVHTFHETMDVAHNFGVPYTAFHYPVEEGRHWDVNYMAPRVVPMAGAPGLRSDPEEHDMPPTPKSGGGLRRVHGPRDGEETIAPPLPVRQAPPTKEKWD